MIEFLIWWTIGIVFIVGIELKLPSPCYTIGELIVLFGCTFLGPMVPIILFIVWLFVSSIEPRGIFCRISRFFNTIVINRKK